MVLHQDRVFLTDWSAGRVSHPEATNLVLDCCTTSLLQCDTAADAALKLAHSKQMRNHAFCRSCQEYKTILKI